jgi:hypothetical protein
MCGTVVSQAPMPPDIPAVSHVHQTVSAALGGRTKEMS